MKSNHHDHEPQHDRKHAGFDHHSEHVFGADSLWSANDGGLSGPHLDRPQDAHDRVIGSTADGLDSSPTSHGATTGSPLASEPSALVTVIGGDAYATGTNTDATGAVNNSVKDLGYATVASGFAVFEASGSSSHGDAAAGADTFLSVAGADIVIEFELDFNFHIGNKDVAVSKLVYYAIDIDNWTPPNGPIVMDFQTHASGQFGGHNGYLPSHVAPSGNLASVAAIADAQGANSLASTLTHSLAVENHFSLVSGAAMVAA
ncbi:MAG: hypothetical protein WBX05_14180 [Pseudolabrys sp.]